jgi:hypothetical protein
MGSFYKTGSNCTLASLSRFGEFKIYEFFVLFVTSILNKYTESHDNADFRNRRTFAKSHFLPTFITQFLLLVLRNFVTMT